MGRKITLRALLSRLAYVRRYRLLPAGVDMAYDIAYSFPRYRVETVFDVGANIGQSAELCHKSFPHAQIYSFEPVRQTFEVLTNMARSYPRVRCFNMALGADQGVGQMVLQGPSDRFFLADQPPADNGVKLERTEITTIDAFCQSQGVAHISYLKIDTEGSDLHVLQGASRVLGAQQVDLVEVEAGMNVKNTHHVPFEVLHSHLQGLEYFLFAIYEQVHEWPRREPQLRRSNLLFISQRMIDRYRGVL